MRCVFCGAEAKYSFRPVGVMGFWADWWCESCAAACVRDETLISSYENGKDAGPMTSCPVGPLFIWREEPG